MNFLFYKILNIATFCRHSSTEVWAEVTEVWELSTSTSEVPEVAEDIIISHSSSVKPRRLGGSRGDKNVFCITPGA